MQITNKIKGLLSFKGLCFADYARELKIKNQSLNTKSKTNAYKIYDLIKLADLTNSKLAFIDENNKPVIIFDKNDIEEK